MTHHKYGRRGRSRDRPTQQGIQMQADEIQESRVTTLPHFSRRISVGSRLHCSTLTPCCTLTEKNVFAFVRGSMASSYAQSELLCRFLSKKAESSHTFFPSLGDPRLGCRRQPEPARTNPRRNDLIMRNASGISAADPEQPAFQESWIPVKQNFESLQTRVCSFARSRTGSEAIPSGDTLRK